MIYLAGTGLGRAGHRQYERTLRERLGDRRARFDELVALPEADEAQQRELALLRWSTESTDPAAGDRHAQRMADPWFTINVVCNQTSR